MGPGMPLFPPPRNGGPAFFMPLFTRVRGRVILRTSPVGGSKKFATVPRRRPSPKMVYSHDALALGAGVCCLLGGGAWAHLLLAPSPLRLAAFVPSLRRSAPRPGTRTKDRGAGVWGAAP